MRARVRDGSFYPFAEITGDFDIGEIAGPLDIDRVRKELLGHLLAQLQLKVWFYRDEEEHEPFALELAVFWPTEGGDTVGAVDLCELLQWALDNECGSGELGYEDEIGVLETLKTIISAAIEKRRAKRLSD